MLKHVTEFGYQLEFVTSVKLPTYLSIFETLLIQLKPSNKLQVKDKREFILPNSRIKFYPF